MTANGRDDRDVRERPALLSSADVASHLALSPKTVRRYAELGQIPSIMLPGGQRRFDPADLEQFIASRREGSQHA